MCPFHGLFVLLFFLETVAKTGMILLAGEVTSRAVVDYQKVVRDTIKHIGYDDSSKGWFEDTFYYTCCSIYHSKVWSWQEFLKEVSSAHQGCIYLITNTKTT